MASRNPSRGGRSGGRSSAPSGSNAMPMVLGGVGVLVVVILLVVMSQRGGEDANAADKPSTPPASTASAPKSTPSVPAPAASGAADLAAPRAGKPPKKPAPALTADTLQKVRGLLQEAKTLCNDGITARAAGKNDESRTKQSAAKDKCDAIEQMTAKPWEWLSEAELEDWALTAEYATLAKLYDELLQLKNKVRKGGGT